MDFYYLAKLIKGQPETIDLLVRKKSQYWEVQADETQKRGYSSGRGILGKRISDAHLNPSFAQEYEGKWEKKCLINLSRGESARITPK